MRLRTEITPIPLAMSTLGEAIARGDRQQALAALDLIDRAATACIALLGEDGNNHLADRRWA